MTSGIGSADPEPESVLGFRNPRIQRLRRLVSRREERRETELVVVEGATLIREALSAGWVCAEEFVTEGATPMTRVETRWVAEGVLERVASTESPRPNVALFKVPESRGLTGVATALVVDRMADPGNLGTVIRSAEAAGFDAVVVTSGSVDHLSPKVVRASAGARFHVPVIEADLDELRTEGFHLLGTSSHQGDDHLNVDWSAPARLAIIVGNEAQGLPVDAPVDGWVSIRHAGRAESLNAAMASTIVCFTAAERRGLL